MNYGRIRNVPLALTRSLKRGGVMHFDLAMALAMVPAQMIASTGGARKAQFTLLIPAPPIAVHTVPRSPLP